MGVVLATRTVESLSLPRSEMVPFLIVGAGYVVRTRSGGFSSAAETHTVARSPLCDGRVTAAAATAAAAAATTTALTVDERHRLLCSAIVVQLKSFADFCYKSVHLFRAHSHRLL